MDMDMDMGGVIMPEHPAHLQQHDGYSRGGGACQVTLWVLERGVHTAHRHEESRGLPRPCWGSGLCSG